MNDMKIGMMEGILGKAKVNSTLTAGATTKAKFDTLNDNPDKAGKRIVGIIFRSGGILDAAGILYEDGSSVMYGNKSGGQEHRIIFEKDDEVKSISGVWGADYNGKAISRLEIETKKGNKYGTFGGWSGEPFKLTIPAGGRFMGFTGTAASGDRGFIESIGLVYGEAGADLGNGIGKVMKDGLKGLF